MMLRAWFCPLVVACMVALPGRGVALDIPKLTGRVVDLVGILTAEEQAALTASLQQFEKSVGPQITVLIISTLEGNPIEDFSIRVADAWKLGDEKRDDGLLLLIAHQDRQVRIEVGQGLEGQIPDAIAGRIIDQVIVPHFKQGNFSGGIYTALEVIAQQLGGRLQNMPVAAPVTRHDTPEKMSPGAVAILILFIAMMVILTRGGRRGRRGGYMSSRGFGSPGGFSSGGFSSSSGGGFSGGGGGFSGGGASGRW